MSKYLITGGAGFIGSNIAHRLVSLGEKVRIVDNLSTGHLRNIEDILNSVEFIEGDFTQLEVAKASVNGIDYVLHQGAVPSVPRSIKDPIYSNSSNISGTLNLLIASRDAGVKRFVFAGSSSVYGDSPVTPKVESMPTNPKSPYAIQKLASELYCQNFYSIYGLETVCLRYFNVFGPRQSFDSAYSAVIPVFINTMLKGDSPIIYGDGNTSRDFTFVDNNVNANLLACEASSECAGEVINIACGESISLNELVAKINKILGSNIKPIYKESRKGDVNHSLADISKAKSLLNYNPVVDFVDGLNRTIDAIKLNVRY